MRNCPAIVSFDLGAHAEKNPWDFDWSTCFIGDHLVTNAHS